MFVVVFMAVASKSDLGHEHDYDSALSRSVENRDRAISSKGGLGMPSFHAEPVAAGIEAVKLLPREITFLTVNELYDRDLLS